MYTLDKLCVSRRVERHVMLHMAPVRHVITLSRSRRRLRAL